MKRITFLILICIIIVKISFSQKTYNLQNFKWLEGKWLQKETNAIIYEEWNFINDTLFTGKNYVLNNNDTVINENLKIIKNKDIICYIATVFNQNNGNSVVFNMIKSDINSLTFENSKHDFPQLISYKRLSDNEIVANIKGNGKSFDFKMQKVK